MNKRDTAPIVLFVYNRPAHTRLTVEALTQNPLASETDLYVFSDAAKNSAAESSVEEVRRYLKSIRGFQSVTINERIQNMGLARSLITGISEVCARHGKVIVVEDDIAVAPHFLEFMNDSLDRYEHDEKVMHISGFMFPVKEPETLPETFFFRGSSCWGWATWKRAWDKFEPNVDTLLSKLSNPSVRFEFDLAGTADYSGMLRSQKNGEIDSWAVRWYGSVFLNSGLCLHPRVSMTRNIGHDGSGVHCDESERYAVSLSRNRIVSFPDETKESVPALRKLKDFNRTLRPTRIKRLISKLRRALGLVTT